MILGWVEPGDPVPDSADVARRVIAELVRAGYVAGDRLPSERQLAAELGVGRSVVREALRSLSLLGVLELRRGDGTYLAAVPGESVHRATELGRLMGPRRIRDLTTVSADLEAVMAALAAERRTDATLRQLDANQRELGRSLDRPQVLISLHRDFHALVWAAGANQVLTQVLGGICSLLDHSFGRAVEAETDRAWIARDHAIVLEAIRYRDRVNARAAMAVHMNTVSGRLSAHPAGEANAGVR